MNFNTRIITSKNNEYLKNIEKLNTKKYREKLGKYYIDGRKMLKEAITYNLDNIETIIITEEYFKVLFSTPDSKKRLSNQELESIIKKNIPIYIVNYSAITKISDQTNPEGVITVLKNTKNNNHIQVNPSSNIVLPILENISDPGNLGTILRTLVSCNIKSVVLLGNTIDPTSSKVLRSSMGAYFKIDIIKVKSLEELNSQLEENNFKLFYTDMVGESIYKTNFKELLRNQNIGIIFGNEANGVETSTKELIKNSLTIPIANTTESLNLSTSLAIVFYEIHRNLIDF